MRDHLGPLQGILEQVVRVDSDLHRAVAEIEDLTRQLVQQHLTSLPGSELFDERWLTFLIAGQLKKERLEEMWERLERQDGDFEALEIDIATSASSAASPVLTALDNIRTLVEVRLAPLVPAPVTVAPRWQRGRPGQGSSPSLRQSPGWLTALASRSYSFQLAPFRWVRSMGTMMKSRCIPCASAGRFIWGYIQ